MYGIDGGSVGKAAQSFAEEEDRDTFIRILSWADVVSCAMALMLIVLLLWWWLW